MRYIALIWSFLSTSFLFACYGLYGALAGLCKGIADEWPAVRAAYASAWGAFKGAAKPQ